MTDILNKKKRKKLKANRIGNTQKNNNNKVVTDLIG